MAIPDLEQETRPDRQTPMHDDMGSLRRDFRHLRRDVSDDLDAVRRDLRRLQRDAAIEVRQRVEDAPAGVVLLALTAGLGLGLAIWSRVRHRAHA